MLISIHAPREGSDSTVSIGTTGSCNFYPRSPRGERRVSWSTRRRGTDFYPRSPRGERQASVLILTEPVMDFYPRSPRGERQREKMIGLIINAFLSTLPARGATHGPGAAPHHHQHFYPRSPRGERPSFQWLWVPTPTFLSTLPARGATALGGRAAVHPQHFYPRSPRGERPPTHAVLFAKRNFYPRSPRGERRSCRVFKDKGYSISIHAPREGSDA